MERCDYCRRRTARPAGPYCEHKDRHTKPDKAQEIVDLLEEDLTDRRGLRQEFEQIDLDVQDDIRDTWAEIIRKKLAE